MLIPVAGVRVPKPGAVASYGYQRSATHRHQGLDLAAPIGAPVLAAEGGVVERIVPTPGTPGFRGYGRVVVLRHESMVGPIWTLYAHLDAIDAALRVGASVDRGQRIGFVGDSCDTSSNPNNKCKGPHLHFEVSRKKYPQNSEQPRVDPTFFLRTT